MEKTKGVTPRPTTRGPPWHICEGAGAPNTNNMGAGGSENAVPPNLTGLGGGRQYSRRSRRTPIQPQSFEKTKASGVLRGEAGSTEPSRSRTNPPIPN